MRLIPVVSIHGGVYWINPERVVTVETMPPNVISGEAISKIRFGDGFEILVSLQTAEAFVNAVEFPTLDEPDPQRKAMTEAELTEWLRSLSRRSGSIVEEAGKAIDALAGAALQRSKPGGTTQ